MTFLNPLVLIGLAAAAIPVILHLLNLRKLKTIEFSTLRFLKELQKTKMRRVKIRQWLLLALRTLLIVTLVLAFSRPALKGSLAGTIGTHAKSTLVILLDDSPSMGVRTERGMVFAQATRAAMQLMDLLKEGDEAYLIRLSEAKRRDVFTPAHSRDAFISTLEQVSPSMETVSYGDALAVTAKLLAESRNFNQEVYILSDAQASQFALSPDTVDLFNDRVKVFLVDVGGEPSKESLGENAGITSAEIKSRIMTVGKPAIIEATVWNYGSTPLKNLILNVYLDGTRVAQHTLTIPPFSSSISTLSIIPKRRGILHGYLQIEDDALEADNTRHFVVNVPEAIRVLSVSPTTTGVSLPLLALTLDKDTTTSNLFSIRRASEHQFASIDLNKFDVLLLLGVKDFSVAEGERVSQFLKVGGGIIIFPGADSDIENYNEVLFSRLGIPPSGPAARTTQGVVSEDAALSFLSFDKIDFAHPLFAELFEQPVGGRKSSPLVESPKVFNAIVPHPGDKGNPVISLSNGKPFLTEYVSGAGRGFLFSVEPGLTWSDFPMKGLFVPLLHRSIIYLAASQTSFSFVVGADMRFALRLKSQVDRGPYSLRSPTGIDERIVPQLLPLSGMAVFQSPNSSEPGIYELYQVRSSTSTRREEDVVAALAVNIAPEESDLRRVRTDALEHFWARIGLEPGQLTQLTASERIDSAILESRFGVELWKYLIGFAVVVALAEMAIGREPRQGETGRVHK